MKSEIHKKVKFLKIKKTRGTNKVWGWKKSENSIIAGDAYMALEHLRVHIIFSVSSKKEECATA